MNKILAPDFPLEKSSALFPLLLRSGAGYDVPSASVVEFYHRLSPTQKEQPEMKEAFQILCYHRPQAALFGRVDDWGHFNIYYLINIINLELDF